MKFRLENIQFVIKLGRDEFQKFYRQFGMRLFHDLKIRFEQDEHLGFFHCFNTMPSGYIIHQRRFAKKFPRVHHLDAIGHIASSFLENTDGSNNNKIDGCRRTAFRVYFFLAVKMTDVTFFCQRPNIGFLKILEKRKTLDALDNLVFLGFPKVENRFYRKSRHVNPQ